MFKLIFFIYILFNFNIAKTSSNEIHVRHNDQAFSFGQDILKFFGVSNVGHLIGVIKTKLETSIKNLSDKVVTLRRGESEALGPETPINRLYNTKEEALHVVVGKHNIQLYLL